MDFEDFFEKFVTGLAFLIIGILGIGALTLAASCGVWVVSWVIYFIFHVLPFPGL